jgi:hypothetical protein
VADKPFDWGALNRTFKTGKKFQKPAKGKGGGGGKGNRWARYIQPKGK